MQTKIVIEGVIPGLNGKGGLIREHWATAKKSKLFYQLLMMEQTRNRHIGKVIIHYNAYLTKLKDWDNHGASFKHLGDSLVKAQIIIDDSPNVVVKFIPNQFKVNHKSDERVEIIITDL